MVWFAVVRSVLRSVGGRWKGGKTHGGQERLGGDVDESGECVGQGLSGPSLGDTDHVLSRQSHGPSLALNRSGILEAQADKFVKNIL